MRLTEEFPYWVNDFLGTDKPVRECIKQAVLQRLTEMKNGEVLVKALNNKSEMIFRGFVPVLTFLLEEGSRNYMSKVMVCKLNSPLLVYGFKNFPAYLVTGANLLDDLKRMNYFDETEVNARMSGKVKEFNSWVIDFLSAPSEMRKKFRSEKIINGLKEFTRKEDSENVAGEKLVKALNNKKELRFCCYAPNIYYIRETGANCFIHAFGGPSLVYEYNNFPCLLVANPSLRLDETYLNEHKENSHESIEGWTD